jgi:hypothetical protein
MSGYPSSLYDSRILSIRESANGFVFEIGCLSDGSAVEEVLTGPEAIAAIEREVHKLQRVIGSLKELN